MPHCGCRIREKFRRRPWCPEIFKPPLTCAVVRERPRMFALTLLVSRSTLVLSNFVRIGGPREIQSTRETGGQQSQVSLTAQVTESVFDSPTGRPLPIPQGA